MKCIIVTVAILGLLVTTAVRADPVRRHRIVGGVDVDIAGFPYQLSLRRQESHDCGASVISDRWALSAAHCTLDVSDLKILTLQGGSSNRLEGGQIFEIDRFENHPQYNPMTVEFDVSVLHTVEPMVGANIQPIPLSPANTNYPAGNRAVVSGWGVTSAGGERATILQAINIPIVDAATCSAAWNGFATVTEDMLCANEPGQSACNMDSGGPLVTDGHQVGIVSWGSTNCSGDKPGVYAGVAHPEIRGWISEETGV